MLLKRKKKLLLLVHIWDKTLNHILYTIIDNKYISAAHVNETKKTTRFTVIIKRLLLYR